jgi:ankyrin repeat protein
MSGGVYRVDSIHELAKERKVDTIRKLLAKSPELKDSKNKAGLTALHIASFMGSLDVIRVLLQVSPDVESKRDNDGATPLLLACSKGQEEAIRYLVSKGGANVNAKVTRGGFTGFYFLFLPVSVNLFPFPFHPHFRPVVHVKR